MAILVSLERTLELAKKVYLARPYNPEYLSEFNQAFCNVLKRPTGLSPADLAVTQCPYSEDQIRTFMILGRRLRKFEIRDRALYGPPVITRAEGLALLAKAWPEMGDGWPFQIKEGVSNACDLSGWMRAEQVIDAPYTHTN